jgi:hypothetical protein
MRSKYLTMVKARAWSHDARRDRLDDERAKLTTRESNQLQKLLRQYGAKAVIAAIEFLSDYQMPRSRGAPSKRYPLSHLYGHFGLVRLTALGHDVPWVKA